MICAVFLYTASAGEALQARFTLPVHCKVVDAFTGETVLEDGFSFTNTVAEKSIGIYRMEPLRASDANNMDTDK